ncbi:hypothetical protein PROFUN_01991 [Planoprotostelium fungivorum]|uniref:BRCT domain-containing protein n=1 Tax=Planoprotostelium fungivorum TaxID=1890364 RepID=A0A2P6NB34_9EUKA|nr:hypothetical protein PROFUN_01991 [Planoprotostelium fungivorum]
MKFTFDRSVAPAANIPETIASNANQQTISFVHRTGSRFGSFSFPSKTDSLAIPNDNENRENASRSSRPSSAPSHLTLPPLLNIPTDDPPKREAGTFSDVLTSNSASGTTSDNTSSVQVTITSKRKAISPYKIVKPQITMEEANQVASHNVRPPASKRGFLMAQQKLNQELCRQQGINQKDNSNNDRSSKIVITESDSMKRPQTPKTNKFKDMTFNLVGKLSTNRTELQRIIVMNGGQVSKTLNAKVTHLIVSSEGKNMEAVRCKTAVERGAKVWTEDRLLKESNTKTEEMETKTTRNEEKSEEEEDLDQFALVNLLLALSKTNE